MGPLQRYEGRICDVANTSCWLELRGERITFVSQLSATTWALEDLIA
jgi:hypothetical protein